MEKEDEINRGDDEPGKWRQILATMIVNLASVTYGVVAGWPSPAIPQLQSDDPPVGDKPMTENEIAWLNAVGCLSAVIVLPFCSTLSERLGRKFAIYLISVPFIFCQLLTAFAGNYTWLFVARGLGGIGESMCLLLLPIYVSEISCDSIRGKLGSVLNMFMNIGVLIGYIMGDLLSYKHNSILAIVFPVIFVIGFIFMPETPVYLVRTSQIDEAIRSLRWLKNNDERTVQIELSKLKKATETATAKSIGIKDLFRDRGTFRGFVISTGLLIGQALCGIIIVTYYTANIFEISGSTMSPNLSAIVVGGIQVFGSWLSILIIERAGRKPLMFISCIGMASSLCTLGAFMFVKQHGYNLDLFKWIPLLALSAFTIAYCIGIGSVPFVIAAEVFQSDLVSYVHSISLSISWITMFVALKFYPLTVELIDYHGCFFLYTFLCICTFLFTWIFVPETKGRSLESILNELHDSSRIYSGKEYLRTEVDGIERKSISTV